MNDTVREYMNETVMENDVFEDIMNRTNHYQTISFLEKYFIISEFIEFVCNVVNIAAYLFLAVTIWRFKRLKSRTNTYILHLAVVFVIFNLFRVIMNTVNMGDDYVLVIEQASMTLLSLYLIIAFILSIDWFISGYRSHWIDKYGRFHKYLLAVLYGLALSDYLLTFVYTHMHHMIRMGISRFFYVIILICLIIINVLKRCVTLKSNSAKTAYAFTVANVIIFSLATVFVWHTILTSFLLDNYGFICISIIPEILWYNHPIIVVYSLAAQNKHFRIAYQKSLKRSVQAYDDQDLFDESTEESRNQTDARTDQDPFRQTSVV